MNLQSLFYLSGYGYLQDIKTDNNKTFAQIKIMPCNMSKNSQDEIWLNCEVNDDCQLENLNQLLISVRAGEAVIIHFKAAYNAFVEAFAGQAKDDPHHIVILQTRLCSIEKAIVMMR